MNDIPKIIDNKYISIEDYNKMVNLKNKEFQELANLCREKIKEHNKASKTLVEYALIVTNTLGYIDKELANINIQENIVAKDILLTIKNKLKGSEDNE